MLSTGTVAGVAGFKSPEERARLYLKPGDVVEAEIERIGVLRNPIVSWQDAYGTPPPPRIRPATPSGARRHTERRALAGFPAWRRRNACNKVSVCRVAT